MTLHGSRINSSAHRHVVIGTKQRHKQGRRERAYRYENGCKLPHSSRSTTTTTNLPTIDPFQFFPFPRASRFNLFSFGTRVRVDLLSTTLAAPSFFPFHLTVPLSLGRPFQSRSLYLFYSVKSILERQPLRFKTQRDGIQFPSKRVRRAAIYTW